MMEVSLAGEKFQVLNGVPLQVLNGSNIEVVNGPELQVLNSNTVGVPIFLLTEGNYLVQPANNFESSQIAYIPSNVTECVNKATECANKVTECDNQMTEYVDQVTRCVSEVTQCVSQNTKNNKVTEQVTRCINSVQECVNRIKKCVNQCTECDTQITEYVDPLTKCVNSVIGCDSEVSECDNQVTEYDDPLAECVKSITGCINGGTDCIDHLTEYIGPGTGDTNSITGPDNSVTKCVNQITEFVKPVTDRVSSVMQSSVKNTSENNSENEIQLSLDVQKNFIEDIMEVCISYKCKQCSYISQDQNDCQNHCIKHILQNRPALPPPENTTYVYLCSNCSQAFSSAEETKQHMIEAHNLINEKFGYNEVTETVKTINVSIEAEKEIKVKETVKKKRKVTLINSETSQKHKSSLNKSILSYSCRAKCCKYQTNHQENMEIHEMCHLDSEEEGNGKKLFKCFQCCELFNEWFSCCTHLYRVHDIDCDLLKCPICETYKTPLPIRLENHIRIHSDVRAFPCKYCGRRFKQSSQMRNHLIIHAKNNGEEIPYWSMSKQCNICFKMYSDSKSLKKHKEEVHSRLRPFVCVVCGHASARKSMLLVHQRQHTGQKPHKCELCEFKTADHNSLRKHMMRHTGVRPYKCPHCDYSAIQSGSYKNHMKVVHPNMEGIFLCSTCQYKTISEDNYIRHISDHLTGVIKSGEPPSENTMPKDTKNEDGLDVQGELMFFHEKNETWYVERKMKTSIRSGDIELFQSDNVEHDEDSELICINVDID